MKLHLTSVAERLDLEDRALTFGGKVWPEFMLQDQVTKKYWWPMFERFRDYQLLLIDEDSDRIAAMGNCAPLAWEGTAKDLPAGGIDWILPSVVEAPKDTSVNTLFALQIVVQPELQGQGLSAEMVRAMMGRGRKAGCGVLYAPVRPSWKDRYPLQACEDYITWRREDGLPYDPWLRVHKRVGGEIIKVCDKSMQMEGTIGEWQKWTGMVFPGSGDYVIPGALVPVRMDVERDLGRYVEPNVWVEHSLAANEG